MAATPIPPDLVAMLAAHEKRWADLRAYVQGFYDNSKTTADASAPDSTERAQYRIRQAQFGYVLKQMDIVASRPLLEDPR